MTDLPRGWAKTRLSEICEVNPRVDKSAFEADTVVSFVPMSAVEAETAKIDISETRTFAQVKQGYTPFKRGDVLFAKITPCMENGKMAIVPEMVSEYGFGSTEFHVLRPAKGIEPKLIYHAVANQGFRYHAEHNMTGAVGQKRVRAAVLEERELDLPPTNEQRRIVEKIEAIFDEIDKGIESLQTARTTLGLYRQSLLKSAFEGRLTADWRARNPEKLEAFETLLARIEAERETRYKAALDTWQDALTTWRTDGEKGKKPAKPKRPKDFIGAAKIPSMFRLSVPSVWKTLPMSDLGQTTGGLTKNQKRNGLPIKAKYLRVANVYSNRLELDEITEIGVTEDELRKTSLFTGDLLFVEGNGSIEQIGRVAIWDGSIENMTHQNHLIRFSADGILSSRFALYFMMSTIGRKLIEAQASSTSGLHTLSISKIEGLPVPICSPAEQAEIVRLLDARLEAADALEAEIEAALTRADALRQSILKKAFSGQLVPQNPDDEPATILLARIKADRAKVPKAKKRRVDA